MISIIVCYRNRKEHLDKFLPHIANIFKEYKYEIIIVEQNDEEKFKRGTLLNEGAKLAKYDIIALHDVDYLPDNADSYFGNTDVVLPVKRVKFINADGSLRNRDDIPSGYRLFDEGVDDEFWGGVTVFKRDAFFKINGFNSLYNGWGKEEEDLKFRCKHYGLSISRNDGTFTALPHIDSFPGFNDSAFQGNLKIFSEWQKYLEFGVNNQTCTQLINKNYITYKINGLLRWIKVHDFVIYSNRVKNLFSVNALETFFSDEPEKHSFIWSEMKNLVNETDYLNSHRNWVRYNDWGYGNKSLHFNFALLTRELPENFKFLEIGVYKGQTISLMSLLNKRSKKNGIIYGITPLNKTGDKYATHPDIDYEEAIGRIYGTFELDASDLRLIVGYSHDPEIIKLANKEGPYDMIYIDGCHDYDVVVSDLTNYKNMLRIGGYLLVDDASNDLNIPNGLIRLDWKGLPDVTNAVNDVLNIDNNFKFCYAVGHNKIYRKIG